MRTPSLRHRVRSLGAAVILVLFLVVDVAVYLSVSRGLSDSLGEVLATRHDIAVGLAGSGVVGSALADRLTEVGIPALVTDPAGRRFEAEPAVPRLSHGGVATTTPFPRAERTDPLPDGGSITVYASRAGTDDALRRLAVSLAAATAGGLALSLLALDRAARAALTPLSDVVRTAERTSAGSSERLQPDRPDTELGRLATAFDEMVDRLADALEDSHDEEERTRRFLADAAHQLRTPLAGIQASVESLLRQSDPGERDRLMGNLVRETGRSSRLVNALLRMAYLDQGRLPTSAPTDVVELVRHEVTRTSDLAPHLTVALVDEADGGIAEIDHLQVREAVGNLLDNARRHAKSRIDVTVRAVGDRLEVVICDDGPGLASEAETVVFERFATLDGKGGSGLGLPIARGVARSHGGDVVYQSGAFVLWVPTASAPDDAMSDSARRIAATSPSRTT